MKFLKFRHNWAYGTGDWDYKFYSWSDETDNEMVEDTAEELAREFNWSDKYRGIEYFVIDYPGNEWMKKQIKSYKERKCNIEKMLGEFTALYYKNGGT